MTSAEETYLNQILECFTLDKKGYQLIPINAGYINDTYLLLDATNPKYILQRINDTVFNNVDGLMENINLALEQLDAPDYSRISLVKTRTKDSFYKDNGYWRLMTYINHSIAYNTTTDPNIAFEAGRIVGKFHQLLGKSNLDAYVDTIPGFHDLDLRYTQFKKAFLSAKPEKSAMAEEALIFVEKIINELQNLRKVELPLRICHNDTKLNNILFSKETNRALCLIDLDTLMKGYFYYDFGDAIRTIVNPAKEDEQDLTKISFNRKLFSAFIKGLQNNGPFLTQVELEHLSSGAIFMPFIHGLRALTDYLENNKYYKVSYENQNLDRSLSLFDFTQKAWNQIDFMKGVIQKELIPVQ